MRDRFGDFWVLDRVTGHVLRVSTDGRIAANLDESTVLVDGVAIATGRAGPYKRDGVAVLDRGGDAHRVIQFDRRASSSQ